MSGDDDFLGVADLDDKYHESSDEDFNPTAAPPSGDESSTASENEAVAQPAKGKRKRKAPPPDELDSGDEITIEAARKRKTKRRKGDKKAVGDDLVLSDDEGGEGGLIKTRAQRRVEEKEWKPLARTDGATVDVDALWAQMTAAPLRPSPGVSTSLPAQDTSGTSTTRQDRVAPVTEADETDLVTVRKNFVFAGQNTTEEKQVPRSTLDQYLADGWKPAEATTAPSPSGAEDNQEETDTTDTGPRARRPLRKPSRFDPNPTGYVRALPPEHQITWRRKSTPIAAPDEENVPPGEAPKTARPEKAQKLNVVDKSRLDWTGFVDKEGIAEELDVHKKTKEAYLGRQEFLAGVEARQEEERLRMRAKTAAAKP